jgi:hypothetical protein
MLYRGLCNEMYVNDWISRLVGRLINYINLPYGDIDTTEVVELHSVALDAVSCLLTRKLYLRFVPFCYTRLHYYRSPPGADPPTPTRVKYATIWLRSSPVQHVTKFASSQSTADQQPVGGSAYVLLARSRVTIAAVYKTAIQIQPSTTASFSRGSTVILPPVLYIHVRSADTPQASV